MVDRDRKILVTKEVIFDCSAFLHVLTNLPVWCHDSLCLVLKFQELIHNKMCGAMHFRHSEMTHQSGDSCLPFNTWQCVIKNDTKKALSTQLLQRCPGSGSMQWSVLWKTLSGLILIKEAVICNNDWHMFLLSSSSPIFSAKKESQLEGQVQVIHWVDIYPCFFCTSSVLSNISNYPVIL